MNAPVRPRFSRRALIKGGALTVGFALTGLPKGFAQGAAAHSVDPAQVDSYLVVNADGTVTLYTGKVDLGQGLRIALRQMAGEELGLGVDKIRYIEGDTLLTPDQGRTSGSNGIQRGGVQIRQAAATARKALTELAAKKLNAKPEDLVVADGEVRPAAGGAGVKFAALLEGGKFNLKLDSKAPLKDPKSYTLVGKPLPRPDVPAKCTGGYTFVQDFALPGMLHARVIRPPAFGAKLASVDESSVKDLAVKVVRIGDFLAVVSDDEWTAVRGMRALKAQWSDWKGLPDQQSLVQTLRNDPRIEDEQLVNKGLAGAPRPDGAKALQATYFWPMQTHGSIGPSAAVADVHSDSATIWTASQSTHAYWPVFAQMLGLPKEKVRLIYLDGAGCYGMNGHEDAAADAALLSKTLGKPVRVQWMREDEHGWDPKGPVQLLELHGAIDPDGNILEWQTEMWVPRATRGLANIPLLAPDAAGVKQPQGFSTGLITQNGDPPYPVPNIGVTVHWLKDPLIRPSHIRAPGKIANSFAVESFFDELAAAAGQDPVALRLRGLTDPRGIEVIKRAAAMMNWQPRPSPGPDAGAPVARGRGLAYVHYKHNETYVAIGMEVAVEKTNGKIRLERIVCTHDCGQIINPDGVRAQVEGNILQTVSRALMEEIKFDQSRVTSLDWASYPILTFSDVPKLEIELIDRPTQKPLGAGEAACAPVGAALANAVFDATGIRLRTVPFTLERVKAALGGQAS